MSGPSTIQRLLAEGLGTALLLATVVGSGIMGESLSGGNVAIALLANSIATGAMLVVLIIVFGPISGAHFNPAVTGVMLARGELKVPLFGGYLAAQVLGGILGVWAAHAMFGLPILEISAKARTGAPQWFAEAVATFGLVITIVGTIRARPEAVAYTVGLYITAAYWFTASTSFANPAVTVARAFTDTFAGIAPQGIAAFVIAQGAGAISAVVVANILFKAGRAEPRLAVKSELSRAGTGD
jgi:glycerol uptake facilitator-like aquaporin